MRFDLGTLDSGEQSLPFGLLVSWCGSNETWANGIDPHNMAVAQCLHCSHTRLSIKNKIKWKIYQTILFTFYSPGDAHHERLRDEDDELLQFAIQQSLMDSGTEADQVLPWKVGKKFGHRKNFYKYHYNRTMWAATWQNQHNECAPSEDSDQPGHPPSLIRVFSVHMKKAWVLSYPLSAQRRLCSDWADAQADLSLHWAHSHCWFCHVAADLNSVVLL